MRRWWFSCVKFTVRVSTRDNIVIGDADIIKKFRGQHVKNLADYMRRLGGFEWKELAPRN